MSEDPAPYWIASPRPYHDSTRGGWSAAVVWLGGKHELRAESSAVYPTYAEALLASEALGRNDALRQRLEQDSLPGEGRYRRDLDGLVDGAGRALAALAHLTDQLWKDFSAHDALPRQLPQPLPALLSMIHGDLQALREQSDALRERLCRAPTAKLLWGQQLSREEYHLLSSSGLDLLAVLGVPGRDSFDVLSHLWYEDDQVRGYVNAGAQPLVTGRAVGIVGLSPEVVHRQYLRPKQQKFFADKLPKVYARFLAD